MRVTKATLAKEISRVTLVPYTDAKAFVDAVVAEIKDIPNTNKPVLVPYLGEFKMVEKAARQSTTALYKSNAQLDEIPARSVMHLSVFPKIRQLIVNKAMEQDNARDD